MSIGSAIEEAALYVNLYHAGNNPKAIKARRKKNKNKKTHRK